MKRAELTAYLDDYLQIGAIKDYGPQGLQIEGREQVNKVVGMVDAQLPCLEAALGHGADMLLVHHGIFWGPTQTLAGSFGRLVRAYMAVEINLYAAHLALDAHAEVGNNAELARRLGLEAQARFAPVNGVNLGVIATALHEAKLDYLVDRFEQNIGPVKLVQAHGPRLAAALGCDTYITGETSHAEFYAAQNAGLNVIYGGHYTTETVGVQCLGEHLRDKFGLEFEFLDLPTGL